MTYLNQIASSRSTYTFLNQGIQKAGEWGGYVIRHLQQIPKVLEQHPYAAIATIAATNLVFLSILNGAIKRWLYTKGEDEKIVSKQAVISNAIVLGLSAGLNLGLLRITKMETDAVSIAILSIANVILRQVPKFFARALTANAGQKQASTEAATTQPSPVKEEAETSDLEEEAPAGSPQKLPTPKAIPQTSLEAQRLLAEKAAEVADAYRLLSEQGNTVSEILKLKLEISQLQSDKTTLEQKNKDEQAKAEQAFKDFKDTMDAKLQQSDDVIESMTKSLSDTQERQTEVDAKLTLATQALNAAERAKADLQTNLASTQQERTQVQDKLDTLQKNFDEQSQNFESLVEEKDALSTAQATLEDEHVSLNSEIDRLELELKGKERIISGYKARIAVLESNNASATNDHANTNGSAGGSTDAATTDVHATPVVKGRTPTKDRSTATKAKFAQAAQLARQAAQSAKKPPASGIALVGMAKTASQPMTSLADGPPTTK